MNATAAKCATYAAALLPLMGALTLTPHLQAVEEMGQYVSNTVQLGTQYAVATTLDRQSGTNDPRQKSLLEALQQTSMKAVDGFSTLKTTVWDNGIAPLGMVAIPATLINTKLPFLNGAGAQYALMAGGLFLGAAAAKNLAGIWLVSHLQEEVKSNPTVVSTKPAIASIVKELEQIYLREGRAIDGSSMAIHIATTPTVKLAEDFREAKLIDKLVAAFFGAGSNVKDAVGKGIQEVYA
ncbi:MAG: hypothetical protein ACK481_06415 [Candidatus Melainabacteria bacterium]|jgi:hypothetical protein